MKSKTVLNILSILGLVTALAVWLINLPTRVDAQRLALHGEVSARSSASTAASASFSTSFTYQGRLTDNSNPANGSYDLAFKVYDAAGSGNQIGSTVIRDNVTVADGLFTVELDFGQSAFDGDARWLEVGVRSAGSSSSHTVLDPRQPLYPVPYALHASTVANGSVTANKIGEPCAENQVLAKTGGTWSCATALLDQSPQQQVDHVVEFEGIDIGSAVEVDWLTLNIKTEIFETRVILPDGREIKRKSPGITEYANFDLICRTSCQTLGTWHDEVILSTVVRRDGSITNLSGSGYWRWGLHNCWPSQTATVLSPDGQDVYLKFTMACEMMALDF
jgi:hypothetical protein